MFSSFLRYGSIAFGTIAALYLALLALMTTSCFQAHVVYLHAIQMTWLKDLDVPELFGFLHNQVTPFYIRSGKETLYAWHILPIGIYRKHEQELLAEPSGRVTETSSSLAFKLLRDDPESKLVIHFHGAGGTVASGYRCPNYRALSAGDPERIHVLTFDYRGFGRSTGTPTEQGVISDAISVVEWAMDVAGLPPSRVVIYSQSLGTAVNMAVAEHFSQQNPPVVFQGHILTAPFADVASLVSTYSVAGTVPILGPFARFPALFEILKGFIHDKWSTKDRIASYVRTNEANGREYRISMIHAEDDYDIPWTHTTQLFWHAVNAGTKQGISFEELSEVKSKTRQELGHAGTSTEWKTEHGIIREELLKYGLHDVIMGNPIVTLAVLRMFEA